MASDGHEALGRRLADERIAAAQMHRGAVNGPSLLRPDRTFERTVLRRIAAIEGILHFILSVLKRAMPLEAEDIERSATLWFQTATTDDEGSGAS